MKRANALLASIFVSSLFLVSAAGCQQMGGRQSAAGDEAGSGGISATTEAAKEGSTSGKASKSGEAVAGNGRAKAGDAVAGDGKARAGDIVAGNDGVEERGDEEAESGKVRLNIDGEPGMRFSGICVVGGEGRDVSGQVPGHFVYEPEGRKVECEIRKERTGSESLKFSIDADSRNSKQKIKVIGESLDLSVSGNSASYSTSSISSSSSSVVQDSSVNSSSYSSSSSSSSSP